MEQYSGSEGRRISVFVLTEITLEYFRPVDRHVMPLVEGTWTHRIVASDFTRPPARTLAPGDDPALKPGASHPRSERTQAIGTPDSDLLYTLRQCPGEGPSPRALHALPRYMERHIHPYNHLTLA
ncbi:hypothetical protein ACWGJT_20605 [Streptomyces xantholiticus]